MIEPGPVYFVLLGAGLLAALAGMLSAYRETRAVGEMKAWPFRIGIPVVRLRLPPPLPSTPTVGPALTPSGEYRVLSPGELLFVPQGWRSHVSWAWAPERANPYALKGRATLKAGHLEVVGRLSLAASLTIPGAMVWLGGCALLGFEKSPLLAGGLLLLAVVGPGALTWHTLPSEISRFKDLWAEVRALEERAGGGPTRR